MPRVWIYSHNIEEAVQMITPYLEDTKYTAYKAIYFDGCRGLAASAVLRAIAQDPPPSLLRKFNKIVHLDCSSWKSRRALQRTIVQELKLPRPVMAILDRQDEEDDFSGIDEASRAEIRGISGEILLFLLQYKCLVVFHNGSTDMVNLSDFGIPQPGFVGTKVLWTFRGRLRLNSEIGKNVDNSHLYLYDEYTARGWNFLLQKEAAEIVGYTDKLGNTVEECCLYLLSLNSQGGNNMDYNWATHASSYWVCDGIIQGGHADEAWEGAAALHQQIHIEDYSSNTLPSFGDELKTPPKRWMLVRDNSVLTVHPESTSFFLGSDTSRPGRPLRLLPNDMFHQSDNLHVLKLCRCTFSFTSPPFHCCRNLRFLGLDSCKDQQEEDHERQDRPTIVFFQSVWVLDICSTNWELASSQEIIGQMSANIREVHINKGRIWRSNMAWRQLQNLRKLRVIEPTSPWETGEMDEFRDMVKMELLDLSGDSKIQVLPSLSEVTSLKTLVLNGCVGLNHVGPEGLPPSLESFSLDAGAGVDKKKAKISCISLAGCARLVSFRLCGSLPNLEELDLSGTLVKTLDLKDQVVQVPNLEKIILLGCLQLHAVLWPEQGLPVLTVLRIDSLVCRVETKLDQAYATIMDARFFQSLVLQSNVAFCWKSSRSHLNLCVPCTNKVEKERYKEEKTCPVGSGHIFCSPRPKLLIPKNYRTYTDVAVDGMSIAHDYNNTLQFQPSDFHVEIGEGISNISVDNSQGIKAIIFAMNKAESLHVHDNSSITTVIPEYMLSTENERILWRDLKRCHVVRCTRMHTVFTILYNFYCFQELETFWASDLQMAHCIWSKGRSAAEDNRSFAQLRNIHLYSCPRLTYVLPLLQFTLSSLETLHIVNCGDLIEVFPVEEEFLTIIATGHRKGVLEFPMLKHIYLHGVYKLQQICEAKMFAPKLETVRLRGCWGLKRLPAVWRYSRRPVVECEKDWWEQLEWDGLESGHHPSLFEPRHHPSLFEPRHSSYYKKPLPRGSVLR